MRAIFVEELTKLALADPNVFFITADLGFGVFEEFEKQFPSQFLNIGVAEQNMIGVATGLALEGRTVFVYSIGNFSTLRCLEQIRNDVCYHDVNVNIVCMGGGFSYGQLGMSHHATEDLAIMRSLPNMTVIAPSTGWEVSEATIGIAKEKGASYLRLEKLKPDSIEMKSKPDTEFKIGVPIEIVDGSDAVLFCTGGITVVAFEAVQKLKSLGISVKLVSVHTLKPLDLDRIESLAANMGVVVCIEEHSINGGLSGVIAELLMELGIAPKKFKRIGLRDTYSTIVGTQDYLRDFYEMSADKIVDQVRELVKFKQ